MVASPPSLLLVSRTAEVASTFNQAQTPSLALPSMASMVAAVSSKVPTSVKPAFPTQVISPALAAAAQQRRAVPLLSTSQATVFSLASLCLLQASWVPCKALRKSFYRLLITTMAEKLMALMERCFVSVHFCPFPETYRRF